MFVCFVKYSSVINLIHYGQLTCFITNRSGYEGKRDLSQINQFKIAEIFTTELKITNIVDCEKQKIIKKN